MATIAENSVRVDQKLSHIFHQFNLIFTGNYEIGNILCQLSACCNNLMLNLLRIAAHTNYRDIKIKISWESVDHRLQDVRALVDVSETSGGIQRVQPRNYISLMVLVWKDSFVWELDLVFQVLLVCYQDFIFKCVGYLPCPIMILRYLNIIIGIK